MTQLLVSCRRDSRIGATTKGSNAVSAMRQADSFIASSAGCRST